MSILFSPNNLLRTRERFRSQLTTVRGVAAEDRFTE